MVRCYTQCAMRQNKLLCTDRMLRIRYGRVAASSFLSEAVFPTEYIHVRITYIALNDGFVRFPQYGRRSPCARAVVLLHQRDRFQFRIFISLLLDNLVYNAHVSYTRGVTSKPGIARQRRRLIHFTPIDFDGACKLRTQDDGVYYVAYWDVRVHVYVTHPLNPCVCAPTPLLCTHVYNKIPRKTPAAVDQTKRETEERGK